MNQFNDLLHGNHFLSTMFAIANTKIHRHFFLDRFVTSVFVYLFFFSSFLFWLEIKIVNCHSQINCCKRNEKCRIWKFDGKLWRINTIWVRVRNNDDTRTHTKTSVLTTVNKIKFIAFSFPISTQNHDWNRDFYCEESNKKKTLVQVFDLLVCKNPVFLWVFVRKRVEKSTAKISENELGKLTIVVDWNYKNGLA